MTHRLATNYAKNYCNRTPIVKVIVENVVTCFLGGHSVQKHSKSPSLHSTLVLWAWGDQGTAPTEGRVAKPEWRLSVRVPGCQKLQMTA